MHLCYEQSLNIHAYVQPSKVVQDAEISAYAFMQVPRLYTFTDCNVHTPPPPPHVPYWTYINPYPAPEVFGTNCR